MLFVVTGTPRSGTQYASRLMTALGLPCDHEKTFRPLVSVANIVRWPTLDIGEASWMGWSLLPLMVGHRVPVLHTLRNPWSVIDSLTNRNHILNPLVHSDSSLQGVREIINAYLPGLFARDRRVDRAAALVLGWNRLIAEHVPDRCVYYVDRLDIPMVRKMLAYLNYPAADVLDISDDQIDSALADISTSTNSGFTIDSVPGVSDPDVAEWIAQYAKANNVGRISTCKIRDVAARQTPEELVEQMDPELAERVNAYAACHGYPTYDLAAVA